MIALDVRPPEPAARTQWQLVRRRFCRHRVAVASTIALILLIAACFSAHWIA
ncbi:MAG: ABC transporter permease, partial [Gemmatimonadaceae bacterium]|nr:ABC transporter permease [Gemmatimonadaceae bacterium]